MASLLAEQKGILQEQQKISYKINGKRNPNAILLNNEYFETNVNKGRSAKSGMIPKDLKNKFLSIAAEKVKFSRSDSQSTHLNNQYKKQKRLLL